MGIISVNNWKAQSKQNKKHPASRLDVHFFLDAITIPTTIATIKTKASTPPSKIIVLSIMDIAPLLSKLLYEYEIDLK